MNAAPKQKSAKEEAVSKQLTVPLANKHSSDQVDSEDEDRALEAIRRKRAEIA